MKTLSPVICILGPTNSGKTDLSLRLFDEISAELISVDSVQIYKHADIGSNKISKELQMKYIDKIINPYTKFGFLTWNCCGVYNFVKNSVIEKEEEYPKTNPSNYYVRYYPIPNL